MIESVKGTVMKQGSLPNEPNTTLEDDAIVLKIKAVNTKTIASALIVALAIATVSSINSPFSDPFFGAFGLFVPFIVIALILFSVLYQLFFYIFGRKLPPNTHTKNPFFVGDTEMNFPTFEPPYRDRSINERPINDSHPCHPLSHHYRD